LQDGGVQSPDIPAPEADAIDTVDRDTGFAALEALLDTAGDDEIPASQEEVENLANCVFATVEESISPAHNDGGDEVGPQMGGEPSLERAKSFDNLETLQVYLDTQCALDCAAELPATQPMFEDGPTPVLHRTSGPVAQPEQIEGKEESKPTAEAMIVESERETFNQQLAMAAGGGGTSRLQEWDSAVPSGDKAPIEIDSQQATPVKDDASAPSGRAINLWEIEFCYLTAGGPSLTKKPTKAPSTKSSVRPLKPLAPYCKLSSRSLVTSKKNGGKSLGITTGQPIRSKYQPAVVFQVVVFASISAGLLFISSSFLMLPLG